MTPDTIHTRVAPDIGCFFTETGQGSLFLMGTGNLAINVRTQRVEPFPAVFRYDDTECEQLSPFEVRKKLKLNIIQWQTLLEHLQGLLNGKK